MISTLQSHPLIAPPQVFVPRFAQGSRKMDMVKLTDEADWAALPATLWGIRQPPLGEAREDALATGGVDVAVVPGVAFDGRGGRLGHGGGFYDAWLTEHARVCGTQPFTIALAFSAQVHSSPTRRQLQLIALADARCRADDGV